MSDPAVFQVFVVGMGSEVGTIDVATTREVFLSSTVKHLRSLIHEKWPHIETDAEDLRILFAGKQLEDNLRSGVKTTLEDYNIQPNSTLQLVLQLLVGSGHPNFTQRVPPPPVSEKVHDLSDFSLRFTNLLPDAITGMSDPDDQPRVKMTCGHAVDPNSLTAWCRSLLDNHQWKFYCPAVLPSTDGNNKQCKKEWDYKEVRQVALLNEAEQSYFESKMSEFAALEYCDMKECPGCRSFVERRDIKNLRVVCAACTHDKKKTYEFCWNCDNEWTGPVTSSVKCGRPDCQHPSLPAIRNALMMRVVDQEVPNRRACPTCGQILEHKGDGCKYIICTRCKDEFCFLCLLLKEQCLKKSPSSWHKECVDGIAPKQTTIPVWSPKHTNSNTGSKCTLY